MSAASRVLVLDDDLSWRDALGAWLSEWGYHPLVSTCDGDWETAILAGAPDLIIVDPSGLDGFLGRILELIDVDEVPVLVFSDSSSAEGVIENGASDFLAKPCSPALLRSRIRSQLHVLEARELLVQINEQLEERVHRRTEELETLNRLFLRFVPRQFQDRIRRTREVEPGIYDDGRVTILFLDVRGFTGLAEKMGAEKSVRILGELFQNFVPIISSHGGYIDNFGGDSFMAIFDGQDSARHASEAAVQMQRWLLSGHSEGRLEELQDVRVGIGINTGHVVYAAIGSADRMTSTVIGDQVNLCSRIEKLTKSFRSQVLISGSTYRQLDPVVQKSSCRLVDNLRVRGRTHPVEVYELYTGDPESVASSKALVSTIFRVALEDYAERRFEEALLKFRECLRVYPQDAVSFEYVRRCRYFMKVMPEAGFFERGIDEGELFIDPTVRRRFPRYSVDSRIQFEFSHNDSLKQQSTTRVMGRLMDISTEGMMIQVDQHSAAVGSIFSLRISFSGTILEKEMGPELRDFICQVRWLGGNSGVMGISFVTLSERQENELAAALETARNRGVISGV